eukprot:5281910-Prymnesium_polylepis.1
MAQQRTVHVRKRERSRRSGEAHSHPRRQEAGVALAGPNFLVAPIRHRAAYGSNLALCAPSPARTVALPSATQDPTGVGVKRSAELPTHHAPERVGIKRAARDVPALSGEALGRSSLDQRRCLVEERLLHRCHRIQRSSVNNMRTPNMLLGSGNLLILPEKGAIYIVI